MRVRFLLPLVGLWCGVLLGRAAEVMPPAPPNHFNDFAGVIDPGVAARLDQELTEFERTTSNQLLVVLYPHMQSDSSIEDYTVRVAQSWKVGQSGKKNGAVLFIFVQDHTLYLQVGYGLEGALPDATCKDIIENEITPRFRAHDFAGGVTAGVQAMMAATRGEYHGSGRSVADRAGQSPNGPAMIVIVIFILLIATMARFRQRRVVSYGRGGRTITYLGGGWSDGGGSSGGGGSFSGGGGSFGGGGAGGRW